MGPDVENREIDLGNGLTLEPSTNTLKLNGVPVKASTEEIVIVETDHVKVTKVIDSYVDPSQPYVVMYDGVVRHRPCTSEDVMRALAHYLQSAEYKLAKK
jgi:hypothetical protein